MANEMTTGILERNLYSVVLLGMTPLVTKGYITSDMQTYVAVGIMSGLGSLWAWWINRPGKLMDAAAAQMPANSKLVITTEVHASAQDKDAAHDLARSAGANVVAKVQV